MDPIVKSYKGFDDRDLRITPLVAYQRDMTITASYDDGYLRKIQSYDPEIAKNVNRGRVEFVNKYFNGRLLDVGAGDGAFVKSRPDTFGYDVIPESVRLLRESGLFRDDFESFWAFSFWDVLEHVDNPKEYFDRIKPGSYVFVSIPIFDLSKIRESKHYRPGEHLYYWTAGGFIWWMMSYGFRLIGLSDHEIKAGREDIQAFAFKRD